MFKKKKKDTDVNLNNLEYKDTIIPFYLNQRVVYDTLATINDGFTELYNVSNANNNAKQIEAGINAKIDTSGNPLTLMSAKIGGDLKSLSKNNEETKQEFKKIHTPTSLFCKMYNYIKYFDKLTILDNEEKFKNIKCGDFVELTTKLTVNTMEEMFRKMQKMCNIGEIFSSFADNTSEVKRNIQTFTSIRKKITDLLNFLDLENERIKYMVGNVGEGKIVIKIDKTNIIDADYDQISNGNFRIIGKVLEVVEENEKVSLNRESVLGLIKTEGMAPIRDAFKAMGETMFEVPENIVDEIEGKTLIIMPIIIGI